MVDEWIMIRVKVTTHTKLQDVRRSLLLAADTGQIMLTTDNRDRVSLDQVISVLIAARENHARRRRKSQAGRRTRSTRETRVELAAKNAGQPNCPKCGTPMTGGAPHGPWPIQWECRRCGTIVVPSSVVRNGENQRQSRV